MCFWKKFEILNYEVLIPPDEVFETLIKVADDLTMSCRSYLALKERAKWAFSLILVQYLYQISCHSTDFFALYLLLKILFVYQHSNPEAATQRCPIKKVFLEILENSQENTCVRVSFLIKLQTVPATLLKRRLWHRCFAVNFAKFLRTPFVTEHLWWLLLLIPFNLLLVDSVSMLILKKLAEQLQCKYWIIFLLSKYS